MRKSSALSQISKLFRHPPPEDSAFQAILELLPQAAILIDCQQNAITRANSKALNLTAFSWPELSEREIQFLFPTLILPTGTLVQKKHDLGHLTFIHRSGTQIEASVVLNILDRDQQTVILLFDLVQKNEQKDFDIELRKQRWQALQLLAQAAQKDTLTQAKMQILQAGQLLTGAAITGIYKFNEKKHSLDLDLSWGNDTSFLPAEIPTKDVDHFRVSQFWKKGERAHFLLTRNAVAGQINCLATAPTLVDEKLEYVLVVADQSPMPSTALEELLALLGQTLTTTQHIFDLISSIKSELEIQDHLWGETEALKETVNDGIIFVSPELKILDINTKAEETLGYKNTEVQNAPLENILIGSQSLIPVLEKAVKTEIMQDLGDVKLHRRDGQVLLAHLRATPIRVNDEVRRTAIVITDMSTREEFRQRTKQLEQHALLGEFSAIFAHEVRNPINNIRTGLQLMKYEFEDDHSTQKQIDRFLLDCDRVTHLMTTTLNFSRSHEYKVKPQDIQIMIENYLARMGSRMNQANIELKTNFHPNLPQIYGDKRALEQVLANIINNAIQVMVDQDQDGGTLGIKVAPSTNTGNLNHINIDISDTGPGIPEATLERIFQPFYTTNQNGTGLGLTIAQKIINAHNGQLSVKSFPGGTVFSITLPTMPPE